MQTENRMLKVKGRKEMVRRIVPEPAKGGAYPDLAARQNKIFGNRPAQLNVGEILRKERSRL
jgi:hypothetical protein